MRFSRSDRSEVGLWCGAAVVSCSNSVSGMQPVNAPDRVRIGPLIRRHSNNHTVIRLGK